MEITESKLNYRQQIALNNVRDFVLYTDRYEVKDLRLEGNEYDSSVYVQMEVGMKDDEGTLAAALCRSCYAFSIGQRGGLYYYDSKTHKRVYVDYMYVPDIWARH